MEILRKFRVLYVEDDKDCCEMMKILLGFNGIGVDAVTTIAEAWALSQSDRFDLFLLDSQFSDGDGLELCRRLRDDFLTTPIYFYSGLAYENDIKNGFDAGADDYLIKPDIDSLCERILSAVVIAQKNRTQIQGKLIARTAA